MSRSQHIPPPPADLILQTAFCRRQWLLQARAGLRIIGSRSSPDARRLFVSEHLGRRGGLIAAGPPSR